MKLNVGCGRDYRAGYVNIDISREVKAEHYLDISKDPLPFENGLFTDVYCSGVLEQILSTQDLIFAMNEMHRVLKPGGTLIVIVPNGRFAISMRDPMDVRRFTRETFEYFKEDAQEHRLYGSVYGFLPWSVIEIEENARHIFTVHFTK